MNARRARCSSARPPQRGRAHLSAAAHLFRLRPRRRLSDTSPHAPSRLRSPLPAPASLSVAALAALAAAAPPSQVNIHYTSTPGTLSVDFVSAAPDGVVQFGASASPASFKNATTTSFNFDEVGYMHQGSMAFAATPGASGFYRVCSAGECTTVFHVVPNVATGEERFAVFGDFGIINDESMSDLIAEASKGSYDSVLHVGKYAVLPPRPFMHRSAPTRRLTTGKPPTSFLQATGPTTSTGSRRRSATPS